MKELVKWYVLCGVVVCTYVYMCIYMCISAYTIDIHDVYVCESGIYGALEKEVLWKRRTFLHHCALEKEVLWKRRVMTVTCDKDLTKRSCEKEGSCEKDKTNKQRHVMSTWHVLWLCTWKSSAQVKHLFVQELSNI